MIGFPTSEEGALYRGDALEFADRSPARRRKDTRHVAFLCAGVPAVLVVGTGSDRFWITLGLVGLEDMFLGASEPFRGSGRGAIIGATERLAVLPGDGHGTWTIPAPAPPLVAISIGVWFVLVLVLLLLLFFFIRCWDTGWHVAG